MEELGLKILAACKAHAEKNPITIFNSIVREDYVRMHGPEHHIIDGACLLVAFKNAGGNINLDDGLKWVMTQGMKVPGAACAHWGICGSVTSIGSALSFIDGTSPLSTDGSWGNHMLFTAKAAQRMGEVNGPRCCKRDAYISFEAAIDYINEKYDVKLEKSDIKCEFSHLNQQCIGTKCPYNN